MKHYQIVNIQEILNKKTGVAYKGEIGVFVPDNTTSVSLTEGIPVYVNAFTYILSLNGNACLSVDEKKYMVMADNLCLLSPLHLTFFVETSDDFKCMFLCLHKDFIDKIGVFNLKQRMAKGMNMHRNPVMTVTQPDACLLQACIENIKKQILRCDHLYQLELIQNALIRFYLELDNILDRKQESGSSHATLTRNRMKLQEFINLLMNHFKEEHLVSFYAQSMNMTPQYLTTIIKEQTGKTVNAFIYELLYSEARNLLISTDLSIEQIASRLHFADQASFSKFFKRQSGLSPQLFRKKP